MKPRLTKVCLSLALAITLLGGTHIQSAQAQDADFVLISTVKINPDQVDAFKETLLPYMDLTRAEDGCVNYFANQATTDPTQFVTYEHWRSPEARAAHLAASYTVQFFKAVGPMFQAHNPPYPIRNQYQDVR